MAVRQNPTVVLSEAKVGDPEGIKQIESVMAAATALNVGIGVTEDEVLAAGAAEAEGGGTHRKVCSVGR
ncbi:MAG TPA: hypothetical protein QF800_03550 [Phycisphaerales bacterium]|nr:hypothetical protein [Phycisphaerales bacterium]